MKKRITGIVLSSILLFGTFASFAMNSVPGTSEILSNSEISFLLENDIETERVSEFSRDTILSVMSQTAAYDFDKEQVNALLMAENIQNTSTGMNGTLSEDGQYFIYPNGFTLPNLLNRHNVELTAEESDNNEEITQTRSFTGGLHF